MIFLLACETEESAAPAAESPGFVPLADARLVRRMSLDLRGALPSIEELDELEGGVGVGALRDRFLADPRFEERFVHLYGQAWRTQVDEFLVLYFENAELESDPTTEYPFERAVGEEPLRLAARVAASDQPWSTVVTGDWSMANEVTGKLWPVDYPAGEEGWEVVRYTDGRPAAGILSTNGLWWRYFSTVSNYNRGRVAAIARILLCEDYTARPVTLSDSSSGTDVEDNLRTNPYCLGCHASIDPAATALFGFWPANEYNLDELERYHPERELLGPDLLGVEPSWFGTPFSGLTEFGHLIAADPRFARCTAETAASLLWRRPVLPEDEAEIEAIRARYVASDRVKDVLAAVTDGERYRAGEGPENEVVIRMLDAPLLAAVLEDLTGFTWTYGGFEQLENDTWGLRLLGGGVDGFYTTRSQGEPGLTWLAVAQRAAEAAAAWAVDNGTLSLAPEPTADDFAGLHRRLYGTRPDEAWTADVGALWASLAAEQDADEAWRGALAAMLQDPEFLSY